MWSRNHLLWQSMSRYAVVAEVREGLDGRAVVTWSGPPPPHLAAEWARHGDAVEMLVVALRRFPRASWCVCDGCGFESLQAEPPGAGGKACPMTTRHRRGDGARLRRS